MPKKTAAKVARDNNHTNGSPSAEPATPETNIPEESTSDAVDAHIETEDERIERVARLTLEDFVVTQLLSRGRSLRNSELNTAAEGFSLTRAGLKHGLETSSHVVPVDRDWELALRLRDKGLSREERSRTPLETALRTLLQEIGKPLPVPVLVRELAQIRGVYPENIRESVQHLLKSSRWAVEVRDNTFLLDSFLLQTGAPREELLIRENHLTQDPDFALAQELTLPAASGSLAERAAKALEAAGRPLSQKVLGFLLHRQQAADFDARELARLLGDRAKFYNFINGLVATQKQMHGVRAALDGWMRAQGGARFDVDVAQILRQRLAPNQILVPSAEQIEEVKTYATGAQGAFSLATLLTDVLEMEPDDERFVPHLQGLNDALRRNPEFMSAGIGQFLLRSVVPSYVGEVPEVLRPVHLSVRSTESNEPLDVEMTDEGLEHPSMADFVHAPQWEDVNEEVEVRLPRRTGEVPSQMQYVVLNHHFRSGTMKLRRQDEEFFAIEGALSRVPVRAVDGNRSEALTVWSSRESGLLYGLGDWFGSRLPQSGGVLIFSRDPQAPLATPIEVTIGEPDSLTLIENRRIEELTALRDPATYLSLFELLQSVMSNYSQGVELPQLWAEVNVIRRTSKRLLSSVLSAYHCYYFKQRGPNQFLWRYDAAKTDQGFKRNKRKFVRR